jgi:wyosine [tRNA(Phe)-imidazoG37] synthetase (radical SAM superfamily)
MEYIFGPVPSRRLGLSLGINIIPHKICSFDCLYCEVGKTTTLTTARTSFFELTSFFEKVEEKYIEFKDNIDVVTVTGAGEPTLNSDLREIANNIKKFIDHPLAILTNSSLIYDKQVFDALHLFDIVVPSLDAVTEKIFLEINKPHNKIKLNQLIEYFIKFSHEFEGILYPEILLLKGINDSKEEIDKISEVLNMCKYTKVHLNTAFRPGAYKIAKALNEKELLDVILRFNDNGVKIEPASKFISKLNDKTNKKLSKYKVLTLLEMRPCTLKEIAAVFNIDIVKAKDILDFYIDKNMIKKELHEQEEFYYCVDI